MIIKPFVSYQYTNIYIKLLQLTTQLPQIEVYQPKKKKKKNYLKYLISFLLSHRKEKYYVYNISQQILCGRLLRVVIGGIEK